MEDYLVANVYDTVTIENSIIDVFNPPNGYYDLPNYTKGRLAATAFRTRQTDIWSYKYYRYDERGRVKTMWQMIDGLDSPSAKDLNIIFQKANSKLSGNQLKIQKCKMCRISNKISD